MSFKPSVSVKIGKVNELLLCTCEDCAAFLLHAKERTKPYTSHDACRQCANCTSKLTLIQEEVVMRKERLLVTSHAALEDGICGLCAGHICATTDSVVVLKDKLPGADTLILADGNFVYHSRCTSDHFMNRAIRIHANKPINKNIYTDGSFVTFVSARAFDPSKPVHQNSTPATAEEVPKVVKPVKRQRADDAEVVQHEQHTQHTKKVCVVPVSVPESVVQPVVQPVVDRAMMEVEATVLSVTEALAPFAPPTVVNVPAQFKIAPRVAYDYVNVRGTLKASLQFDHAEDEVTKHIQAFMDILDACESSGKTNFKFFKALSVLSYLYLQGHQQDIESARSLLQLYDYSVEQVQHLTMLNLQQATRASLNAYLLPFMQVPGINEERGPIDVIVIAILMLQTLIATKGDERFASLTSDVDLMISVLTLFIQERKDQVTLGNDVSYLSYFTTL